MQRLERDVPTVTFRSGRTGKQAFRRVPLLTGQEVRRNGPPVNPDRVLADIRRVQSLGAPFGTKR